jgi:hypothetical protein
MWTICAIRRPREPAVVSPVHARWWNRTSDGRRGRIVTGAVEVTDAATTRLGGGWTASSTDRKLNNTSRKSSRGLN